MLYRGVEILQANRSYIRIVFGNHRHTWLPILQTDERPEDAIDRLWDDPTADVFQPIYKNGAKALPHTSIDGIPWEIHRISDPAARAEATQAFQMNMLTSDDVRPSSEEASK